MAASVAPAEHPSIALMLAGYVGLATLMGLLGGVAATLRPARHAGTSNEDRVRRMAVLALAATLPLLLLGGLVTSSLAGLSVPDWPGTYGGNMFLYPISLMASEKHVYLEHSHRLFGALVGMTSIALLVTTLALESRRWMKAWATTIFLLVCVQGLLGGFRVTESSTALALAHGVLAQIVFLLMAMFAAYTTAAYVQGPASPDDRDRRRRTFATALLHSLLLQLAMGAAYRHTGSAHILYTHIALAFLVVTVGMVAGMAASGRIAGGVDPFSAAVRRTGSVVVAVVILQFILGWGAWSANPPGQFRPVPKVGELPSTTPVPAWKVAIRTAHQANGAILIASAGVLFVLIRRIPRGGSGSATPVAVGPAPRPLAATAD
jgi:cytochrome c oxidase assembly protein subunit 15